MSLLTLKEAKELAKEIEDSVAEAEIEADEMHEEYRRVKKVWYDKWGKINEKAIDDRRKLREDCPHEFPTNIPDEKEASTVCNICGQFYLEVNRGKVDRGSSEETV